MNYEHSQKVSAVRDFLLVSLFVLGPLIPGYIWWRYPLFVALMQVFLLPLIFFLFVFPISQSTVSLNSDYLEFRFRYKWPKLVIDLKIIYKSILEYLIEKKYLIKKYYYFLYFLKHLCFLLLIRNLKNPEMKSC